MAQAVNNVTLTSAAVVAAAAGEDITWVSGWSGPSTVDDDHLFSQAITTDPDDLAEGDIVRLVSGTIVLRQIPAARNIVSAIIVTSGGSGYTTAAPAITFTPSTRGATAVAVVESGVVTAINVTNPGFGYTTTPTVVITPDSADTAGVTAATATAVLGGGETEAYAQRKLAGAIAGGIWMFMHTGDPGTSGTDNLVTGLAAVNIQQSQFTIT